MGRQPTFSSEENTMALQNWTTIASLMQCSYSLYPYCLVSPTQSAFKSAVPVSNINQGSMKIDCFKWLTCQHCLNIPKRKEKMFILFCSRNHLEGCFSTATTHIFCSLSFLFCRRKTAEFTFCFAYLSSLIKFSLFWCFQEENRGLRLKEELVVAAPRLQQPAIADQPDEEKLRLVLRLDGIR